VWDPVIGDQHLLRIPPGLGTISEVVLRAAGDVRSFEVVLVGINDMQQQAFASVYSSNTGLWGNLTTTPLFPGDSSDMPNSVEPDMPAVMIGDSLYWLVVGSSFGILEFDLGRRSPGMITMPVDETINNTEIRDMLLIMAEGGGLGLLILSGFSVQLWKRKTNCDGVASWVLGKSIALDKQLSINSEQSESPYILGFAEDNNLVLLWTSIGIFTVQLESLQFNKLFESKSWFRYFAFEAVYTAGITKLS
jgi:hypothetical protein